MKKLLTLLLFITLSFSLIACEELGIDLDPNPIQNNDPVIEWVALDLTNLEESYELGAFDLWDVSILVQVEGEDLATIPLDLQFIDNQWVLNQVGTHQINVNYQGYINQFTLTLVEPSIDEDPTDIYFYPEDIPYDGPRLNMDFLTWPLYQEGGNPYKGTGGAFYVGESFTCIDGDTTVFDYPSDIREKITNRTPSTRYLNFDTPETFPVGGEEVWGKTASVYNCDVLNLATSIILQTDPGDNLTGRYGRLLAWVWVLLPGDDDYQLLNYLMVRHGLGEVKYLFGAGETEVTMYQGLTYTEWMFLGQDLAIQDGCGMHSDLLDYYWDYTYNRPFYDRW